MSAFETNFGLCMAAGATMTRTVEIKMAATSPNDLPSSATGDVVVTFIEREEGAISDSATAAVTRRRVPAYIVLDNRNTEGNLRPNGIDTAYLKVSAFDDQMVSVADGTPVTVTTSIGVISPTHAATRQGEVDLIFTTPATPGTALLNIAVGPLSMTSTLVIAAPLPDRLTLVSGKSELPAAENTIPLTVTVSDKWGNPVANQKVRLGVSGDGERGTVDGSEVITGTTNGAGQIVATFTRGSQAGPAPLTATLLVEDGGGFQPSLTEKIVLLVLVETRNLFLPQINR